MALWHARTSFFFLLSSLDVFIKQHNEIVGRGNIQKKCIFIIVTWNLVYFYFYFNFLPSWVHIQQWWAGVHKGSKRALDLLEKDRGGYEPLCTFWGWDMGPLQDQQILLTDSFFPVLHSYEQSTVPQSNRNLKNWKMHTYCRIDDKV